jgi:hypothetical protein
VLELVELLEVLERLELVEVLVLVVLLLVDGPGAVLDVVAGRDVDVDVDVLVVVLVVAGAWVRQVAACTDGAMRLATVLPKTRSMLESPPVRWQ